ncbi:MAG: D-2-hydroxyacid dehydrogenase [Myxococcota bacterium]
MKQRGLLVSELVARDCADALARRAPDLVPVVVRGELDAEALATVEAAFFSGDLYPDHMGPFLRWVSNAPELRWLHSFSAGVDNPFFQGLLNRGVRVTTSSGANARAVAQLGALFLLALARELPARLDAQRARRWERRRVRDLEDARLVVLGMGPIGAEIARLGTALGMKALGLRRTPRGDEPCPTWPLERLDEALAGADFLALALPLTPETRGLLGRDRLARLPRGACLVNVGRGELIDESALVEALQSGQLAGAGLDVFETEPLPETSPLWNLPNVLVTPHDGGFTPASRRHAVTHFLENLSRWTEGAPLVNEAAASASDTEDGNGSG